jgi:hypothetical protein
MGTPGHMTFIAGGERKETYCHWDGYPSGLGNDILQWLRPLAVDTPALRAAAAQASALRLVDDGEKPTPQDRERYAAYFQNLGHGDDWYEALRSLQGDPAATLAAGIAVNGEHEDYAYRYEVDFDAEMFRVVGKREWPFSSLPEKLGDFSD